MTCVVGGAGTGKSSLLSALAAADQGTLSSRAGHRLLLGRKSPLGPSVIGSQVTTMERARTRWSS